MAGAGAVGAAVGEAVEVEVPPVPCFLPPGMTTGSAAAGGAVVVGAAVGPAVVGAVAVGAVEDKEVGEGGGGGGGCGCGRRSGLPGRDRNSPSSHPLVAGGGR